MSLILYDIIIKKLDVITTRPEIEDITKAFVKLRKLKGK